LGALKKTARPVIPRKTIYRLSLYLRCLARLRENGLGTVSSEALARAAGVKSTQLRKDLACFGTFGTRGASATRKSTSRSSAWTDCRCLSRRTACAWPC
jgi:NADH/NAD ratio-sensing transcriptional regulator Rex